MTYPTPADRTDALVEKRPFDPPKKPGPPDLADSHYLTGD